MTQLSNSHAHPQSSPRIHIVGAGFSGLTLAYELSKQKHPITLYENSHHVGGLIQTKKLDDALAETAANAFFANDAIVKLCLEIGVRPLEKKKSARRRYIYRLGRPRQWPLFFLETLGLFFRGLFYLLTKKKPETHESISSWWTRCFGKPSLDFLIGPALQGIYAGNTEKMSAGLLYQQLFHRTKTLKHPLIRGSFSFQNGMKDFIDALETKLRKNHVEIKLNADLATQEIYNFIQSGDWVIFCCGPSEAVKYLHELQLISSQNRTNSISDHSLFRLLPTLMKVDLLSLIKVTLVYNQKNHSLPKDEITGFGILFPEKEKMTSLGVLMDTSIFDHRGENLCETWILGGSYKPEILDFSDKDILDAIQIDRKKVFRYEYPLKTYHITRWRKTLPHYDQTIEDISRIYQPIPPLFLHGNYLGKIGLSKIYENSIQLSKTITELTAQLSNK